MTCYDLGSDAQIKPGVNVSVENRFNQDVGVQEMKVGKLKRLCVPSLTANQQSSVAGEAMIEELSCYAVNPEALEGRTGKGESDLNITVTLVDEFGISSLIVAKAKRLCTPTSRDGRPIVDNEAHLVCYKLTGRSIDITADNYFSELVGTQVVAAKVGGAARSLCVPSKVQAE